MQARSWLITNRCHSEDDQAERSTDDITITTDQGVDKVRRIICIFKPLPCRTACAEAIPLDLVADHSLSLDGQQWSRPALAVR